MNGQWFLLSMLIIYVAVMTWRVVRILKEEKEEKKRGWR